MEPQSKKAFNIHLPSLLIGVIITLLIGSVVLLLVNNRKDTPSEDNQSVQSTGSPQVSNTDTTRIDQQTKIEQEEAGKEEIIKQEEDRKKTEQRIASLSRKLQQTAEEINQLETELTLVNYIKAYISDPSNKEQLIPTNVANDVAIAFMITSYNNLVTSYDRLKITAGEYNPDLQRIKSQMDAQMKAIKTAVDILQRTTQEKLKSARSQAAKLQTQLSAL